VRDAGPNHGREREHLPVSDKGIIMFRPMLDKQITAAAEGQDPFGVLREPHEIINLPGAARGPVYRGNHPLWRGQAQRSFAKPCQRTGSVRFHSREEVSRDRRL
jgi:hypothetical protein